jgi:hypothetical protein
VADHLQPGEVLFAAQSQSRTSADGRFILVMQSDGNLVLYRTANWHPLWATGTNGQDVNFVAMQGDGNLVIYTFGGRAIWASNTSGRAGAFLVVQNDGNVVIYYPNTPPIWATNTHG